MQKVNFLTLLPCFIIFFVINSAGLIRAQSVSTYSFNATTSTYVDQPTHSVIGIQVDLVNDRITMPVGVSIDTGYSFIFNTAIRAGGTASTDRYWARKLTLVNGRFTCKLSPQNNQGSASDMDITLPASGTINATVQGNLIYNVYYPTTTGTLTQPGSIKIGFDFFINGNVYTKYLFEQTGMYLGDKTYSSFFSNTFNNPNTGWAYSSNDVLPGFFPYMDEFMAYNGGFCFSGFSGTAPFYSVTTGVSPNRVHTFQVSGISPTSNGCAFLRYQIRLYESNGVIEFHYGPGSSSFTGGTRSATAGIVSSFASGGFLSVNNFSTSATASSTTSTDNISTLPALNTLFRFTPQAANGTASGLNFTNATPTTVQLNWTDNATNENNYFVLNSTDNITFTQYAKLPPNSTSMQATGLTPGQVYYWRVVPARNFYATPASASFIQPVIIPDKTTAQAGAWSDPSTWSGGIVPSGNESNIIINHNVVIDQNLNLTNINVASGVLSLDATTNRTVTLDNMTIAAGATFQVAPSGTATGHLIQFWGDLVVTGTLTLYNNNGNSKAGLIFRDPNKNQNITFTEGAAVHFANTVNGLGGLHIIKASNKSGSSDSLRLFYNTNGNISWWVNNDAPTGSNRFNSGTGFISIASGTLEISGIGVGTAGNFSNRLFYTNPYTINPGCSLIVNNGGFRTCMLLGTLNVQGLVELRRGGIQIGLNTSPTVPAPDLLNIENGGTLVVNAGGSAAISVNGAISFQSGSRYLLSGGTISFTTPSYGAFEFNNTLATNLSPNSSISTNFQLGTTADNNTFRMQGAIGNLTYNNVNNNIVLTYSDNLRIQGAVVFLQNGHRINLSQNTAHTLTLNGTITYDASNTPAFELGGTNGSLAISPRSINSSPTLRFAGLVSGVATFNNLTIDNQSGVTVIPTSDITVNGTFTYTTGAFTLNGFNLNLNGPIALSNTGATNLFSTNVSRINIAGTGSITGYLLFNGGGANALASLNMNRAGQTFTLGNVQLGNDAICLNVVNGKVAVAPNNTITLLTNVSIATNGLVGNSTGNITVAGSGSFANLVLDQTTPGTTNVLNTLTINRAGATISLGSALQLGNLVLTSGRLNLNGQTLTLRGSGSSTSSTNCIVGGGLSSITISGGAGAVGTLFFDQTTDGTTNSLNNLTANWIISGSVNLGNKVIVNGALSLSQGLLQFSTLFIGGTYSTGTGYLSGNTTLADLTITSNSTGVLSMQQTTVGVTNNLTSLTLSGGATVFMGNNWQVRTLNLQSGRLALNGQTLTLTGNVTSSATNGLIGTVLSNLVIAGSGVISPIFFDQGSPGNNNALATLTVNRAGQTVQLGNTLITGRLTLTNGRLGLNGQSLTINGTGSSSSSANCIIGSSTSSVILSGTGAVGSLFFDQTTDGTTNILNNLTLDRTTSGSASIGNKLIINAALTLTNGLLQFTNLQINGTYSRTNGFLSGNITQADLTINGSGTFGTGGVLELDQTTLNTTNNLTSLLINRGQNIVMGNNFNVGNLTLQSGNLSLNGRQLTISGNFSATAPNCLVGSTSSSLTISGSGTASTLLFDQTVNGTSNALNAFTLNRSGLTLNLGGALFVNSLTLTNGRLGINGQTLGFRSGTHTTTSTNCLVGSSTSSLSLVTGATGSLFFDQTTDGTTNAINNLTLNGSTTLTVGNKLVITGTLSLISGQLPFTNLHINGTYSANTGRLRGNVTQADLSINGSGTFGTGGLLEFDQTTPGTTDYLTSLTLNRGQRIVMGHNFNVGTLNLTNGSLDINGKQLTLNSNFTGSALNCLVGSTTSVLSIGGSGAISPLFFDQTVPGSSNALSNLIYNRSGQTITLSNPVHVYNEVRPTDGVLQSGGNLVLISNATSTALVSRGATNGGYLLGDVIAQRFVPAVTRRFRMLGPVTNNFTYNELKDDIHFTGNGGTSNGFDASPTDDATAFTYQESNPGRGWNAVTNITNTLAPGQGAIVFVRGDRNTVVSPFNPASAQTQVTLDIAGPINTGNISPVITYTNTGVVANDGWNLVSNPYPCPIDWNLVTKTNIDAFFYRLNATSGAYEANQDVTTGNQSRIIAAGQAFWVKVIGANPSITFTEACKVTSNPSNYYKTSGTENTLKISLIKDALNTDWAILKSHANASVNYTQGEDALKLTNSNLNLSFKLADGNNVQINAFPLDAVNSDTFKLEVTGGNGAYQLVFDGIRELFGTRQLWLVDLHLNSIISLSQTPQYTFNMNGAASSKGLRFLLVTSRQGALPVSLLDFKARFKDNARVVNLSWTTSSEYNNQYFEVQRSLDGVSFEVIGLVKGTNSPNLSMYYFDDNHTANNINSAIYYRLKQVDFNNTFTYTNTVSVRLPENMAELFAYPNPTEDVVYITGVTTATTASLCDLTGNEIIKYELNDQLSSLDLSSFQPGVYMLKINQQVIKLIKK